VDFLVDLVSTKTHPSEVNTKCLILVPTLERGQKKAVPGEVECKNSLDAPMALRSYIPAMPGAGEWFGVFNRRRHRVRGDVDRTARAHQTKRRKAGPHIARCSGNQHISDRLASVGLPRGGAEQAASRADDQANRFASFGCKDGRWHYKILRRSAGGLAQAARSGDESELPGISFA
jgi:hypothetical protein